MKVLVLSNTPWSIDNSFGNSFSNIFGGIEGLEFANIYCRYGEPNNDIVKKHFQITEKSLLKNLKDNRYPSGNEVFGTVQMDTLNASEKKLFDCARNKRLQIFFWLRDIIWKIGRWKSPELKKFITDFNPDVIFQPVYYSNYINEIALFIKELTNIPMICYVSDDVYTLRQFSVSPFYWIDRIIKRRKVKKVVEQCEYLYVVSDIQKQEYEKCFKKKCLVLTKGADFTSKNDVKEKINIPIKLIYTGNIGGGRWKSLASIGKQLCKINHAEIKAHLFIYSTTPMTKKMNKALNVENTVFFMGGVPSRKIPSIHKDADVLVHVEPIDLKGRLQVHQSFSTKIVDYFHAARCVFSVGTKDMASIDYIIKNDAGIVAKNKVEIKNKLVEIINNPYIILDYANKSWNCGKRNHQIDIIQNSVNEGIHSVLKEDKNESIAN